VPQIVLVLLQGLFLLLLYLFLARAVRAVIRDVRTSAAPPRAAGARGRAPAPAGRQAPARGRPASPRAAARRQPSELVVHTPGSKPRIVTLDSEEIRIGRSKDCAITVDDSYVSEQHARVYRTDEGWVVADMGSTNGTYLNRNKLTAPTAVQPGDQLGIGKTVVEVRK
jgi:pSer/pThr/pTyr-binding forkhead associated (FHA) protein